MSKRGTNPASLAALRKARAKKKPTERRPHLERFHSPEHMQKMSAARTKNKAEGAAPTQDIAPQTVTSRISTVLAPTEYPVNLPRSAEGYIAPEPPAPPTLVAAEPVVTPHMRAVFAGKQPGHPMSPSLSCPWCQQDAATGEESEGDRRARLALRDRALILAGKPLPPDPPDNFRRPRTFNPRGLNLDQLI